MNKTIKYTFGVFVVIVMFLAIAVFGILQLYWYHNPYLAIEYGISQDGSRSMPRLIFAEKSIFGCSDTVKARVTEYSVREGEMERYLLTTYKTSLTMASHVENVDGQTILTFTGKGISEDGTECEIREQVILDFILTENIPVE